MTRLFSIALLVALLLSADIRAEDEITLDGEPAATQPAADTTDDKAAEEAVDTEPTDADADPADDTFATDEAKLSYGVGMNLGMMAAQTLSQVPVRFDIDLVLAGIEDALKRNEPRLTAEAVQAAMGRLEARLQAQQAQVMGPIIQQNRAKGTAFRDANAKKEGVTTTASGLQYRVVKAGDGPSPVMGDRVAFNYRLKLVDGQVLESSFEEGRQPLTTPLEPDALIPGMIEAIQLMKQGATWELVIPADLAYGDFPQGPGGPGSTLVFDIELISVEKASAPAPAPAQP